jgi:hypothetical protein
MKLFQRLILYLTIILISCSSVETPLKICWNGNHGFLEGEQVSCPSKNYKEAIWNKNNLPLSITVKDSSNKILGIESNAYKEVNYALKAFNSQVGFKLFKIDSNNPNVILIWGAAAPLNNRSLEYCKFYKDKNTLTKVEINVNDVSSIRTTHRLLIHLLGHAVRLKHASYKGSIMYPIIRDDTFGQMSYDRLGDKNVRLLRNLYEK